MGLKHTHQYLKETNSTIISDKAANWRFRESSYVSKYRQVFEVEQIGMFVVLQGPKKEHNGAVHMRIK